MNENSKRLALLETEDVKKALLRLGIPTMAGMLVSALYNLVDALFIGRLGTLETAAVSILYPLTMVGTGIGLLFGSGAGSYISRLLGQKDYRAVAACSSTAILTGVAVIALLAGAMLLFFDPLMGALGATDSILPYARAYGILYIIGIVFNVFNMILNNLLVAEGAASMSTAAMLAGGFTNLVLDPVLIFGAGMGVAGAAAATLISQMLSSVIYLFCLRRGGSLLTLSPRFFKPSRALYAQIVKIGLPVCFFQFLSGGAVGLTNVAARPFGEAAIAAMGIVNRLMSLKVSALYGFLKGYSPLVGYSFGARQRDRVNAATRTAVLWSTAVNILFGLGCLVFSGPLIHLFNQESAEVLAIGRTALSVDGVAFMTLGLQIVIGNYFLATGKAKQGGILSVCRQGIFFIPFLFIFTGRWGLTGLIFAQLAADLCATAVTLFLWKREPALKPA